MKTDHRLETLRGYLDGRNAVTVALNSYGKVLTRVALLK
jgi:hypothetical protein